MADNKGIQVNVAQVYFVQDRLGMDYVLKQPNGLTGRYMKKGAIRVQEAARVQAGVGTGLLKLSIHHTQERTSTGQMVKIGSPLSHALMHHEGTRPHLIHARGSGTLRFTKASRVVYTRVVLHPGTRPNKFLSDNIMLFFA